MSLSDFFSQYFNSLWQILLLPLKFIVSFIIFLGLVADFISSLFEGVWGFIVKVASLIPAFLAPFFYIIIAIRIFKFLTKRSNNHRGG